jgi:glycosyltransferase involved in cell wall biosynthesis
VVGFDYHVGVFCRKLNAHSNAWRFKPYPQSRFGIIQAALAIRSADALIGFAGPAPHRMLIAAARAARVPVFVIWAGTDVSRVIESPDRMPPSQRSEFTHIAVAPWLVSELRTAGISAQYIPVIGVRPEGDVPMPDDAFRVLTYLPEPRRDFYGRQHVYAVARRCPKIKFLIVGPGGGDPAAPHNVEFLGWRQDITPFIDRSVAVMRVPEHDGMSLMVLEALARGRYVAWTYAVPGVRHVHGPDDTVAYLNDLFTSFSTGRLGVNEDGLAFATQTYEEQIVARVITQFIEESVAVESQRKNRRLVTISGLDIFATEIARLNNTSQTGWNAIVLQFETRYEALSSILSLARSSVWYTIGTPLPTRLLRYAARLLSKSRIMHWVGSDIETASRNPALVEDLNKTCASHLTEVDWEVEELQRIGISAKIAPLPPRFSCCPQVPPLPREFTLLTYLPSSRPDFYGGRVLEALIRSYAGKPIRFLIVGGGKISVADGAPAEALGWRWSLDEVYPRVSALFRFTPRDGLSLMVLEALSFGRHVLWTKKFPFVQQVTTADAATSAIDGLLQLHLDGQLTPQQDAASFVQQTYDKERCLQKIVSAWDEAAGVRGQQARLRPMLGT